jgi:hypothetical protein
MVERLTTFVEGWRNNDFFEGAVPGQRGSAQGFMAGVLVRFPEVTSAEYPDDEEYLLWGNGNFEAGSLQGWAITAFQTDTLGWAVRFSLAMDDGAPIIAFVDWEIDNTELLMTERSLFIHAFFDPTVPAADPTFGMFINGVPTVNFEKDAAMIPSTLPPRIGGGVPPVPITPTPTQPFIEPRLSIAGVSYRDGDDVFLGNYFQAVWERVQEVDDITQLPDGSFLWDNIWSARRRLPNVMAPGQVWNDLTGEVALVRTGGGDTLESNAAKAHWWNQ